MMTTRTRVQDREGPIGKVIEKQAHNMPSDIFLWAAGASIAASLGLKLAHREDEALFVGQWAPTFLLLGVFNKLVKVMGEREA